MKNLLVATQATQSMVDVPGSPNLTSPPADMLVGGSIAAGVGVFLLKEAVVFIRDWQKNRLEMVAKKESALLAEEQADQSMLQEMIRDLRDQNKALRDQNQTLILEICNLRRMMDMSGPILEPSPKRS